MSVCLTISPRFISFHNGSLVRITPKPENCVFVPVWFEPSCGTEDGGRESHFP